MHKLIYHIIRLFNKKAALNYALDRQIKSMRYWHNKVMDHGIKTNPDCKCTDCKCK